MAVRREEMQQLDWNVTTLGYNARGAGQTLDELMTDEHVLLIDTRKTPWSQREEWRQQALREKYGKRYRYAGHVLGHRNYNNGGPIEIVDPATGLRGLRQYLSEGYRLVLLCGCAQLNTCHRKVICEMLCATTPGVRVMQPDLPTVSVPEDSMMCLSIRQPWSWLIANGHKDIENRDWSTSYRGPLLIHAGSKVDDGWFHPTRPASDPKAGQLYIYEAERLEIENVMPNHISAYPLGAIVGICDLVDVVTYSESKWFCGKYGFVLENARPIEPIPYSGALKLFPVPLSALPQRVIQPVSQTTMF
jgi:hypothetical protein